MSAEDARVAEAGVERLVALESARVERVETGVHVGTGDEVRDVTAERRRELEPVPARSGVDEDALGDLADHGLPVRAHVVEADPPATRRRVLERRGPPHD